MLKQLTVSAVSVLAIASAGAVWAHGDERENVVYKGESAAKEVCMAIVHDDVDGLRDAFRHGRLSPLERSHLLYECNDQDLDEFAFTMDAASVSEYLAPKFGREGVVTIEQVGSIND